jgi:hypothetical protein
MEVRNMNMRSWLLAAVGIGLLATVPVLARSKEKMDHTILMRADLKGDQVTPSVHTDAYGYFRANLSKDHSFMTYDLTYADLEGDVQEAALHFGQPGANGGVATYLCSNLADAPDGTPECPGPRAGTASGRISAADVLGPEAQGVANDSFDGLLDGMNDGTAYVIIKTNEFPDGELRGSIDVEK